jgi:hypothetical protein
MSDNIRRVLVAQTAEIRQASSAQIVVIEFVDGHGEHISIAMLGSGFSRLSEAITRHLTDHPEIEGWGRLSN